MKCLAWHIISALQQLEEIPFHSIQGYLITLCFDHLIYKIDKNSSSCIIGLLGWKTNSNHLEQCHWLTLFLVPSKRKLRHFSRLRSEPSCSNASVISFPQTQLEQTLRETYTVTSSLPNAQGTCSFSIPILSPKSHIETKTFPFIFLLASFSQSTWGVVLKLTNHNNTATSETYAALLQSAVKDSTVCGQFRNLAIVKKMWDKHMAINTWKHILFWTRGFDTFG